LERAARLVDEGMKVRKSAEQCGVDRMTLTRYISSKEKGLASTFGYKANQLRLQVFSEVQEQDLCSHMNELADKFYGVSSSTCRSLAYQFANSNNIPIPRNWNENKMAAK